VRIIAFISASGQFFGFAPLRNDAISSALTYQCFDASFLRGVSGLGGVDQAAAVNVVLSKPASLPARRAVEQPHRVADVGLIPAALRVESCSVILPERSRCRAASR
jgi:hypothetical protein